VVLSVLVPACSALSAHSMAPGTDRIQRATRDSKFNLPGRPHQHDAEKDGLEERPVSSLYIFLWITAEAAHKPARSPIRDKPNRDKETKRMSTPWPIPAIS
jgi:hypothetical protein